MTCTGCRHTEKRWRYLGWRMWCARYRCLRNIRCIDWIKKGNGDEPQK